MQVIIWVSVVVFGLLGSGAFVNWLTGGGKTGPAGLVVDGFSMPDKLVALRERVETERIALLQERFGQQGRDIIELFGLGDPRALAIDSLTVEALLALQAQKAGLSVNSSLMQKRLHDQLFVSDALAEKLSPTVFSPTGLIEGAALELYLKQNGVRAEQFDLLLKNAIEQNTFNDLVFFSGSYISKAERKLFKSLLGGTSEYLVLDFPLSLFEKKKEFSREELEQFWKQQNNINRRYWSQEERVVRLWKVRADSFTKNFSQEEIEREYLRQKTKRFVKRPTQVKIRRLVLVASNDNRSLIREKAEKLQKDAIAHPEHFAKLIRENASEGFKKNDGIFDFFARGAGPSPEVEREAFRIKEDGGVSSVIETKDGFEIIQRIARRQAEYETIESVKPQLQALIAKEKFTLEFPNAIEQIIVKLRSGSGQERFDAFVTGLDAKKSEITVTKDKKGTKANDLPESLYKKITRSDAGAWGWALAGDDGYVFYIERIIKSTELPYESVANQVASDYKKTMAQRGLKNALNVFQSIVPMLCSSNQSEQKKLLDSKLSGVSHKKIGWKRSDESSLPAIVTQGLVSQGDLEQLVLPGQYEQFDRIEGSTVVLMLPLEDISEGSLGEEKIYSKLRPLISSQRMRSLRAYIATLRGTATIDQREGYANQDYNTEEI